MAVGARPYEARASQASRAGFLESFTGGVPGPTPGRDEGASVSTVGAAGERPREAVEEILGLSELALVKRNASPRVQGGGVAGARLQDGVERGGRGGQVAPLETNQAKGLAGVVVERLPRQAGEQSRFGVGHSSDTYEKLSQGSLRFARIGCLRPCACVSGLGFREALRVKEGVAKAKPSAVVVRTGLRRRSKTLERPCHAALP